MTTPQATRASSEVSPLLRPKCVAIVGASTQPGNGRNAVQNLVEIGFPGAIYPINPRYQSVLGLPCYPGLADLPEVPEALYIGLNAPRAIETVREAARCGVRAVVVHAGGFAETGAAGAALQTELAAAAGDMLLCGPNCLGFLNAVDRVALYGASMPERLESGDIGAVFQSGSTLIAVMNAGRPLRFSYLISSGNEAGLTCADYFDFLLDDPGTRVIIGFIEGFRQPHRFLAFAQRAAGANKPVILLKPGRSERGRRAALAHTGAMAGSDEVLEAVFRKYGLIRAGDVDELIELALAFSGLRRLPARPGVALTCVSGGEMAVILDRANELGLVFPEPTTATTESLREVLPPHVQAGNPLDMTATGLYEPDLYRRVLGTLAADPAVGMVAVAQDMPPGMGDVQSRRYQEVARAIVAAAGEIDKPLLLFSNVSGGFDRIVQEILADGRVPALLGCRESLTALMALGRFASREPTEQGARLDAPLDAAALDRARRILATQAALSEHRSKALLALFGVPVPRHVAVGSVQAAVEAADNLGYPVVLKIDSPDIAHKTEAGGVRLGLPDGIAVARAYEEILASARRYRPAARIDGVLVEEMAGEGTEVILGCHYDPQFGPVILFGLGGVFVEILRDVALALPPLDEAEAAALIRSVRSFPLLTGIRGRPPGDLGALVNVLVTFSRMAAAFGDEIQSLEINPLLVRPAGHGVMALDALVVPRK